MDEVTGTIKEIQEGGKRIANHYLSHGYVLLSVQSGARIEKFPDGGPNAGQYYIRRNPVYVLGRPEGVEPAEPPPKRTFPEKQPNKGESDAGS
jgi:hypothetical protein